jgi:hypothetical protein
MNSCPLFLLAVACAAQSAAMNIASSTIKPGDGTINGAVIQPYDNLWVYTLNTQDGKKLVQGLWSDHVQKSVADGKPALLRVQGLTFVNGRTSSTVNVFDPATLAPISGRLQGIDGQTQSRVFNGRHVSVISRDKDGVETKRESDLPAAAYDFNGDMYGLILVGLPLRAGLEGRFESLEEYSEQPATESFKIVGKEKVAAGAKGNVDAWKVLVDRPAQYTMTFWITNSAPYIIKLEYSPAARTEKWDWDMV